MTRKQTRKPSAQRLAANVLATYERATDTERFHAVDWYREAHALARSLSPNDVARGAAVIAVLSPQMSWTRNVEVATRAFERGDASGLGLGANCAKANRLLAGEDPAAVVSGRKVSAFYANILDPDGDAVTIDRHAFDIANGKRGTDVSRARLSLKGMYERYVDAYKLAAREVGIGALELQAIVWVAWRRENGITA